MIKPHEKSPKSRVSLSTVDTTLPTVNEYRRLVRTILSTASIYWQTATEITDYCYNENDNTDKGMLIYCVPLSGQPENLTYRQSSVTFW